MKTISITKKSILTAALMLFIFTSNVVIGQTNITTSNGNSYSFNSSSKNGVRTYHVKNGQKDFRIEYEGEITLSNDDKNITAISRGGFIEIKKSSFGTKRRILIHNESGTLVKKYFVGWSEKPFRTEGRTVFLINNAKRKYILDYKLESLEEVLNPSEFFRVNRTFIINISDIQDVLVYSNSRLKITSKVFNEKEIIVSREKVNTFKALFEGN